MTEPNSEAPLMTVEEFLNELAQERSLPDYQGVTSAYTSATSNQLENSEEFQQNDDFALSPNSWPQVQDLMLGILVANS
jgi:hypothetical protein